MARPGGYAVADTPPDGGAAPGVRAERKPGVIALVAASLDTPGGQGIQAHWLAEHLSADGFSIMKVPVDSTFPRGLRWLRKYPYLRTVLNEILYLARLTRLSGADVVHVFSASYFSFLLGPAPALLLARLLGKRVILNYHSGEAADHLARWGLAVHPWLRLAHRIVVPSEYLGRVFSRHGYEASVVPNLIDLTAFRYRERARIEPRFLSVRNLEPHYGVDTVIRAFARIQRDYPHATLLVAGFGSEEKKLKRLAQELGVRGASFHGRFSRNEAPEIYAQADILLNASLVDNQPVSMLEAFASGVPVVSTPTGDIAAMLEGGTAGLIVAPRDPEAMALAAMSLIERPQLARWLARRGQASLERYAWPRLRRRWSALYGIQEP